MKSKTENSTKYFPYFIIVITGLSYFLVIFTYAQNIPIYDDFADGVTFIIDYKSTPSISDRIAMVFAQYNQHRIITNRIVYAFMYSATGTINFYAITIAGNVSVLILAFIYCSYARKTDYPAYISACCCALLFQISCFHAALWPMTVLSNYSVLCLSLLSLFFLDKQKKWAFYSAMIFAFLAVFSLRSGQFILPCGLLLLALKNINNGKNIADRRCYIWIAFSILTIYLFYNNFDNVDQAEAQLSLLVKYPAKTFISGLALLGSPFAFDHINLSISLGALSLVIFFISIYKKSWKNPAIFSYCCFLLIVLATLTFSRSWIGVEFLIKTERYRFVAINYWICLFLLTAYTSRRNGEIYYTFIAFILLCFSASLFFIKIPHLIEYTNDKEKGVIAWKETGDSSGLKKPILTSLPVRPEVSLKKLHNEKIYNPP